jgi:outer membrane protein insertion porin family/translocation and assembly module TamA
MLGVRALAAQDITCQPGDAEVRALRFEGARAIASTELAAAIVTTPSSPLAALPLVGTRRCLNRGEFARDVTRLEVLYRRRGFSDVKVDTAVSARSGGAVAVTFRITEGPATRVRSVVIDGFDPSLDVAAMTRDFPLRAGELFDRGALDRGRDSLVRRLRNVGYPDADVLIGYEIEVAARAATVFITADAGARVRFGPVRVLVDSTPGRRRAYRVNEVSARRTFGLVPGEWYSARALIEAQRRLYQTDAFRRVDVELDTAVVASTGAMPITVRVLEGDRYAARVAPGWATLDCFRVQGELTDRDFLPWAPRLELTARVSKVGIGHPLDAARGLCPQARADPYSDTLNYYVGATLRQPAVTRARLVPSLSIYSATLSEFKAFLRRTPIGGSLALQSPLLARWPSTLSYNIELGRTTAEPAFYCAVFNACDEELRDFLGRTTRLAALGFSVSRQITDNAVAPTRGSVLRLDVRHASTFIGSDASQQFNRGVADATVYQAIGRVGVLTLHARGGAVLAATSGDRGLSSFVPPQERLYAGGPTTVRGFRQNELGPAVYIVRGLDTVRVGNDVFLEVDANATTERVVPTGGNRVIVLNAELQLRSPVLPRLLQWAVFTDAGQVWNRTTGASTRLSGGGLRVTPGAGVRILSPFGAIRFDLGYNGYELTDGAAYFNASPDVRTGRAPLFCVSPGNRLPLVTDTDGTRIQRAGSCPATFRPAARRGLLGRLNPSIWIGQAF